jgi:DNA invertase Pin-like site-specific DNA recombinase
MVDDTSRLARYLPDVLKMNDSLQYHGVFIYAVAQRLDCREKTSRPLLTLHGMMDEQFLVSLGEKVHRGQEGRALNGMQPGGKCYGYRNVPIEDPTRSGKYGRFAVNGVKLEIIEEEAAVVRRIFDMYADGNSQTTIAKTLNAGGVGSFARTEEADAGLVYVISPRDASERTLSRSIYLESHKERTQSGDGSQN